MPRLRRYRLFVLVAVLTTATIYHLSRVRNWDVSSFEELKHFGLKNDATLQSLPTSAASLLDAWKPTPILVTPYTSPSSIPFSSKTTPSTTSIGYDGSTPSASTSGTSRHSSLPTRPTVSLKSRPIETDEDHLALNPGTVEEFGQYGQGRLEVPIHNTNPRWTPQKEHFPVPSNSLISLPSGKPKSIPKIQHGFQSESSSAKADRLRKLATIKESFQHAWTGYKTYAMPHDELAPVSGDSKDPFNGWGATLVDTLDTLWIMGLTEEFEDAIAHVKNIDFKTSNRKDIPLFETVIRYLGGLVSAYDLTSGKYPVLLDKAVELAEILMGAFDTPNRMPATFYYWTPSYASQAHRAGTRVVLAELGSLSVEFTRLAQITKEAKYYDAIARLTDELEHWQMNTTLPGLWPVRVDASGCKKPEHTVLEDPGKPIVGEPVVGGARAWKGTGLNSIPSRPQSKRQLDDASFANDERPAPIGEAKQSKPVSLPAQTKIPEIGNPSKIQAYGTISVDCEPQRLTSPPNAKEEIFGIGGMADSAYEYLPKEYMLLGGLNDQYQTMYEDAMNAVRKELIFRPMTKDGRDILFVGSFKSLSKRLSTATSTSTMQEDGLIYEGTHLTCFAGGMFAIGAKIFGLDSDLDIAKRLTDGCIWAYESTATGIMPETFELVPCDGLEICTWNQTKWWEALDPYQKQRTERVENWNRNRKAFLDQSAAEEAAEALQSPQPEPTDVPQLPSRDAVGEMSSGSEFIDSTPHGKLSKRQLVHTVAGDFQPEPIPTSSAAPTKTMPKDSAEDGPAPPLPFLPDFTPEVALSHEEFAQARINEERLPPGFTEITSRKYILRPEAIESIFIMFRITGDEYWREKGWKMFTAIQSYTVTEIGNSAISDVTSQVPIFADTMESFWLAETLKYFYLLYSDPSLISLDDFVLNTEAHPFRRPH